MADFKTTLDEFLSVLKRAKPSEYDGFDRLKEREEQLEQNPEQIIPLIKDPEAAAAAEKLRTGWGDQALNTVLKSSLITSYKNSQKVENKPADYIELETVKLEDTIEKSLGYSSDRLRSVDKHSDDWLQSLPEEQRKEVEAVLPDNVKIVWKEDEAPDILLTFPNPTKEGKIFLNKKNLLEKANLSVTKVDTELQDKIVEALTSWFESWSAAEERYLTSQEYLSDYAEYIEVDPDDMLDRMSDRVVNAVEKLRDHGIDDGEIVRMLKDCCDDVVIHDYYYKDNELGRYGDDSESESELPEELSAAEAAGLPTRNANELLNMLDEEHFQQFEEATYVRTKGEIQGDRLLSYAYLSPGYRGIALILDEHRFLREFRRMQKDYKKLEKLDRKAAKENTAASVVSRLRKYPTVIRIISNRNDFSGVSS